MTNKQHTFKLIDNSYSVQDAKEVLTSLLSDKIRFLNVRILSMHEQNGADSTKLEKRVKQLEADRSRILELMNTLSDDSTMVEVFSEVKMNVVQKASIQF